MEREIFLFNFIFKTIVLVSFLSLSTTVSAITTQITGTFGGFQWTNYVDPIPQVLNDLNGTSFNAFLNYDENASPTSITPPYFVDYANQGSFSINTVSGSANSNLGNLQTFKYESSSNFNGFSSQVELTGLLASFGEPISMDFQFQSRYALGLSSFALPNDLNLGNFDGMNIVRITFAPTDWQSQSGQISILGVMSNLTPVPEPEAYNLFLVGLGFFGLIILQRKNKHGRHLS